RVLTGNGGSGGSGAHRRRGVKASGVRLHQPHQRVDEPVGGVNIPLPRDRGARVAHHPPRLPADPHHANLPPPHPPAPPPAAPPRGSSRRRPAAGPADCPTWIAERTGSRRAAGGRAPPRRGPPRPPGRKRSPARPSPP